MREIRRRYLPLAILAVQQVTHCAAARFVGFFFRAAIVGVHGALGFSLPVFLLTAAGTVIGKPGLAWRQFEFVSADRTDFLRIGH